MPTTPSSKLLVTDEALQPGGLPCGLKCLEVGVMPHSHHVDLDSTAQTGEVTLVADIRPVADNVTPPHTASRSSGKAAPPDQVGMFSSIEMVFPYMDVPIVLQGDATSRSQREPPSSHQAEELLTSAYIRNLTPVFSDNGNDDDNWIPQTHGRAEPVRLKRKPQATDEADEDADTAPAAARPKKKFNGIKGTISEKVKKPKVLPKPKGSKVYGDSKELDGMANAEQKRLAAPKLNKHIAAMRRIKTQVTLKAVLLEQEHNMKAEALQEQITHLPPAPVSEMLDIQKTKFEWQDSRAGPVEKQVVAWSGKKWTDEHDFNITWLIVPASQKYLSVTGRMVSMSDIVNKSVQLPEIQHVEDVIVKNKKTGENVVGSYKIRYEKMDATVAEERMKILMKQAKVEAAQAKKGERARMVQGSRARSRSATTPTAVQFRRERARARAARAE